MSDKAAIHTQDLEAQRTNDTADVTTSTSSGIFYDDDGVVHELAPSSGELDLRGEPLLLSAQRA